MTFPSSDAECFARVNRRCQRVVDLINQAQDATNPTGAADLYREARELTEEISGTVRHRLALMTEDRRADAA
jgi:hypothetical protein